MNQTAFSQILWQPKNLVAIYNPKDHFIDFSLVVVDFNCLNNQVGFIMLCDFSYSEDASAYTDLMRLYLSRFAVHGITKLKLSNKKPNGIIQIFNSVKPISGTIWNNDIIRVLCVDLKIMDEEFSDGHKLIKSQKSYLNFRWHIPTVATHVKSVKITFLWKALKGVEALRMENVYTLDNTSSKSNGLKSPIILSSQISNNVKVYKDADTINVTGAEPGENIKVYTKTGALLKSVLANEDVVNIKLEKNQIYIVNAGQARYKIAL